MINVAAPKIQRIESLDWLRGLMAASIMCYHYVSWEIFQLDADGLLGKLGIYAVSIFFVLSGLSLSLVYSSFIKNAVSIFRFFIRRIFRIWPLMWLATGLFILFATIEHRPSASLYAIFLNITTLFGFIDFGRYLPDGAWSIGNEMVYYAFTPAAIILFNKKRVYGNILLGISVIIGLIFSSLLLRPDMILAQQWNIYINPFNNLFLFIAGIALYYNFKEIQIGKRLNLFFTAAAFLSFWLFGVSGNQILLVTGFNRILFSALCVFIVFLFWKLEFGLPQILKTPIAKICAASYAIYLLHPFALRTAKLITQSRGLHDLNIILPLAVALTIFASLLAYSFLETPFIKLGKKLTRNPLSKLSLATTTEKID